MESILTNIVCNKCGNTLPPHTTYEHFDENNAIHLCPHAPTETAHIWLMTPNNKNIQMVKYDFPLSSMFPNKFEYRQFCIDDIYDYYIVFFDAENGGAFNPSAVWIARYCGVAPTGNFVIMRKKWFHTQDDYDEYTVEMDITPKEFKAKYLK